jgi:hypothetical protein
MKVGQRFDVVEVTIDSHPANDTALPVGFWSVIKPHEILENAFLVYSTFTCMGCTFTLWESDYKKVGTLIITKLK